MTDPVREALAQVEGDDGPDGDRGDDPRADLGEGDPDDADAVLSDEEESDGFSLFKWAKSVPEGSHRDHDVTDWWDPAGGAENRLAFHLADVTEAGGGYPNGVGVLVSFGELYAREVLGWEGDDADADDDDGHTTTIEASA